MGHDYVVYAGRSVVFRDPMLNLVRCIMDRVANDPATSLPDCFRPRLLSRLSEFKYICNGVFTDLKLDDLLQSHHDIESFLGFLKTCSAYVESRGPILGQALLNDLVGDSDGWNVDLEVSYPLEGLERLVGLVSGVPPAGVGGVPG
jgi:hypothetical protein